MFIDLNIPFPEPILYESQNTPKKQNKEKQKKQGTALAYVQASTGVAGPVPTHPLERLRLPDRKALRERVEMLVYLGYTIIAFTQTLHSKLDPSTHVNWFDGGDGTMFRDLDPRFNGGKRGVVQLRRLNIVLDETSEKGFGFTAQTNSLLLNYDILSLTPLTTSTFQSACLQHTQPSASVVHLITPPLTSSPRLPFYMKHTLVRTALKNGARFEVCCAGVLGGEGTRQEEQRNWWTNAREVVRAAAGGNRMGHEGVVFSSGAEHVYQLRAPGDIMNLGTTLGLAHVTCYAAVSRIPKSLIIRAETRKTYRAILSEPKLILPTPDVVAPAPDVHTGEEATEDSGSNGLVKDLMELLNEEDEMRKRKRDGADGMGGDDEDVGQENDGESEPERKRKKKRRRKNR
ncbi:PHP domain-like protein [Dacryopinax primogenitus]|uniref:PHP domain-like protein n=1 Tax=Dacryopinax primogenitus (strain DJM 731) TaxID=1858805 RepID=M5FRV9_DACPD|nr:PHP domain-like protein [Dacryopinax primogenitus]EJT97799.1 PHP domain-like protein [Dacryopinax primogenitus]